MTRQENKHGRLMTSMRAQYWESLPTRAYKIRKLVRKLGSDRIEPGEREQLELLAQRLAESGDSFGFEEISAIGARLSSGLTRHRGGEESALADLSRACDDLDRFIDDMTIEVLAMRLRAVLG